MKRRLEKCSLAGKTGFTVANVIKITADTRGRARSDADASRLPPLKHTRPVTGNYSKERVAEGRSPHPSPALNGLSMNQRKSNQL